MIKSYQVRRVGSGEDIRDHVDAKSREEAIEKINRKFPLPWGVRKTTCRPTRPGDRNDYKELKMGGTR